MKFLLAIITLLSMTAHPALATQKATLNSNEVTVQNAANEDIVVERTSQTPAKVKLFMNPRVVNETVCAGYDYRTYCAYDSYRCGVYVQHICNAHGCRDVYYPRYCCYMREYCNRWETVAHTEFDNLKFDFKKSLPLGPAEVDTFDVLTSTNANRSDVRVLSSARPYNIKKKGTTFSFEQKARR